MKVEFKNKEEVVECLVSEWKYRTSQFYNTEKSKQVEKFWTFNRCVKHLFDLRDNFYIDECGGIVNKMAIQRTKVY
jgi:hypothetical protein